jgi:hemerythrin-like domain-containing protein
LLKIGRQADHGFDEPLGLLSDCHRRIEWFLGALLAVSRQDRGRPLTDSGRRALEQALSYFATAAPRHTADEEDSLFPLLRASPSDEAATVVSVVERLEGDHRRVEAGHALVHRLASRWIESGTLTNAETNELVATLELLQQVYAGHIGVEDREVFPAASRLLSPAQLEEVGRQMAERRGVKYRGPISRFFGEDHDRLGVLLDAAATDPGGVRFEPFGQFRAGILRHIAMEEKRLIPAATEARGGQPPALAARLRVDHGAIAALLVPTPRPDIVASLRALLERHNQREEEAAGLYDECDRALGAEAALRLVEELRGYPEVRLRPYNDGPVVESHIEETLRRSRAAWEGL